MVLKGVHVGGQGDDVRGGDPRGGRGGDPPQNFCFAIAFVTPLQTCWACLGVNLVDYFE